MDEDSGPEVGIDIDDDMLALVGFVVSTRFVDVDKTSERYVDRAVDCVVKRSLDKDERRDETSIGDAVLCKEEEEEVVLSEEDAESTVLVEVDIDKMLGFEPGVKGGGATEGVEIEEDDEDADDIEVEELSSLSRFSNSPRIKMVGLLMAKPIKSTNSASKGGLDMMSNV